MIILNHVIYVIYGQSLINLIKPKIIGQREYYVYTLIREYETNKNYKYDALIYLLHIYKKNSADISNRI